ncbi:hypothetical protein KEM55_002380 [Ascosphaera atra]|nr:hypothetical protein KEM55_002380 [Ascosphaera atra]
MDKHPGQQGAVASSRRATVIGIYGVKGSGKSHVLQSLKRFFNPNQVLMLEGSDVIASFLPGGLDAFTGLPPAEKTICRARAISAVQEVCLRQNKTALVVGHYSFWNSQARMSESVCTPQDLAVYSHILYLDTPEETNEAQILGDLARSRAEIPARDIKKWKEFEIVELRRLCHAHGIPFALLPHNCTPARWASTIESLMRPEASNSAFAQRWLDDVMATERFSSAQTVLVFDGDRTLAPQETGRIFWEKANPQPGLKKQPLYKTFGAWKYCYPAFQQAALLYEEVGSYQDFTKLCKEVANTVTLYPELRTILRRVATSRDVIAIVVTSGVREVWDKVLQKEGLGDAVKVFGGGRASDSLVVDPNVKKELVSNLKNVHGKKVHAFGDSPIDLDMLLEADHGVVVVGEENGRSRTMDECLSYYINDLGLKARQAVLPSTAVPRLSFGMLPLVDLSSEQYLEEIFGPSSSISLITHDATVSNAAKLLATSTRNSSITGPELQAHHRQTGRHLARGLLADVIGLEETLVPHVQGHNTVGFRFAQEDEILIIGVMRAGLFIAEGVHECMPASSLLLARDPCEVSSRHLKGKRTVVLADHVVNEGATVREFLHRLLYLEPALRVIIVAGVVQAGFVTQPLDISVSSKARGCPPGEPQVIDLVTLRASENKYKGKGPTDTGDRLFNTVYLD